MASPTKSVRLKLLLERGLFPEEIPPSFISNDLAKYRASLLSSWPQEINGGQKSHYQAYSIPQTGSKRRKLAVVNPIPYFYLSKLISDNWIEIRSHLKISNISIFYPEFASKAERTFYKPDFDLFNHRIDKIAGTYGRVFRTDVVRCYPSIYTHSIPWGLYGKDWCKRNLNGALKGSLGDKLDKNTRYCQGNQSVGIPIGPDTSRVLSEIIFARIDQNAQHKFQMNHQNAVRNVDDMVSYVPRGDDISKIIANYSSIIHEFELDLNFDKTHLLDVREGLEYDWAAELSQYQLSKNAQIQPKQIKRFFTLSFELAKQFASGNVLLYAVKRCRTFFIHDHIIKTYQYYLQRAAKASPVSLPFVIQILLNLIKQHRPIDRESLILFLKETLITSLPVGHDAEAAWALYALKTLNAHLDQEIKRLIEESEHPVIILLALDAESKGLFKNRLVKKKWRNFCNEKGLWSDKWLIAYEATRRGWIKVSTDYISKDKFYSEMLKKNIAFYDPEKNVKTISASLKMQLKIWHHQIRARRNWYSSHY